MTENTIHMVKINRIINECKDVKTFMFHNSKKTKPKPGQFVMVWVPGVDEIPMSISAYDDANNWAITIKKVGDCTEALHNLKINDFLGVRGPLGNSFNKPVNKNMNIFLIGGGIGMAPLRFLAYDLNISGYEFTIIQGAKVESNLIFMDELYEHDHKNSEFHVCTDDGSYGEQGVTTDIFEKLIKDYTSEQLRNTVVYSCGPETMLFKLFQICRKHNIEFYASLERIMRCGCGICGLCALDPLGLLVCKDGPVFDSKQLNKIEDFGKFKRDFTGKKIFI